MDLHPSTTEAVLGNHGRRLFLQCLILLHLKWVMDFTHFVRKDLLARNIHIKGFIATADLDDVGCDPKIHLPDPSFNPEKAPPPAKEGLVHLRLRPQPTRGTHQR